MSASFFAKHLPLTHLCSRQFVYTTGSPTYYICKLNLMPHTTVDNSILHRQVRIFLLVSSLWHTFTPHPHSRHKTTPVNISYKDSVCGVLGFFVFLFFCFFVSSLFFCHLFRTVSLLNELYFNPFSTSTNFSAFTKLLKLNNIPPPLAFPFLLNWRAPFLNTGWYFNFDFICFSLRHLMRPIVTPGRNMIAFV